VLFGTALGPAKSHVWRVSLKRFFQLEREFHVVSSQIAHSGNLVDRRALMIYRNAIMIEAYDIVRKLRVVKPNWCLSDIDPEQH
jgi:hypothetical protein